jgi:two-component system, OmpR family, sensor histidine kinase KdpD
LHVRIIDRGPGIPVADRERVRAPFQRLGDSDHDGNVGLGMAIASGFITAMHGELTLDDTPGGGLTATIVLPIVSSEWVPT